MGALVKNELYKMGRLHKLSLFVVAVVVSQMIQLAQWRWGPTAGNKAMINGQSLPLEVLKGSPLLLALLICVLAADLVADEYKTGTLRLTLLRPVGRNALVTAKTAALLTGVALAVIATVGLGYVVGGAAFGWGDALFQDGTVVNGGGVAGLWLTAKAAFVFIATAFGFGMLVLFVALLTTNVGATVGVGMSLFVLAPLFEGVGNVRDYSIVYLLRSLHASVVMGGADGPITGGLVVAAAYAAVFYLGCILLMQRKDVLV